MAPLPLDLFGGSAASDGTYAYYFGGYSFSTIQTVNTAYRYDPVADSWTTLAPLPQAEIVGAAVYYPPTNKIYVFGGSDRDAQIVFDLTQVYDIASNSWSMGPTMPAPRSQMARGYNPANGKIYLNGGYETAFIDSVSGQTWEFDPAAGTFTEKAPSPQIQGGTASGVINGHLMMAGGRTNPDATLDLAWDYNIASDSWTQLTSMPVAENVAGRVVAEGHLWSIGGGEPFAGPFTTTGVVSFDPGANAWAASRP